MNSPFIVAISRWINTPTVVWICLFLIVALCILMILKESLRTIEPVHFRSWIRKLDLAIIPLVVVFGVIILLRFISLLVPV